MVCRFFFVSLGTLYIIFYAIIGSGYPQKELIVKEKKYCDFLISFKEENIL
jgi:hypothetical protein